MSCILYVNESKQKTSPPLDKYAYLLYRVNGPANLQALFGQSKV